MNENLMMEELDEVKDQIDEVTDVQVSDSATDDNGSLAETLIGIGITVIGGIVVSKAIEFAAPKVIAGGKKLVGKFRKSKADDFVESEETIVDSDVVDENSEEQ